MGERDDAVAELAAQQQYLLTRSQIVGAGYSGALIQKRVAEGRWLRRQPGVYQVDFRPQRWVERVLTAVLAAGQGSLVSHRTALKLWNLDGVSKVPIELTVPFGHLPVPDGVIVHRTRRVQDTDEVDGIPITNPARTLLDCAAVLPTPVLVKALDSAVRRNLTNLDDVAGFVSERGGRGVTGTRKLRGVIDDYASDTSTGSPAESLALFYLRRGLIPEPVLQHEFITRNGPRRPDFYWPQAKKAVEVDGLDTHSSAAALDDDLERQNDLLDLGIELRRFSARQVRRNPERFVTDVRRFLGL
ncbi:MAG: type IV toxin-antitoxin system AbiEi family antitoxin domain-containing protein [Acidimicrobiia bacterium]